MSINGSLDTPFVKTQRMFRELRDFTSIILRDHDHHRLFGIQQHWCCSESEQLWFGAVASCQSVAALFKIQFEKGYFM